MKRTARIENWREVPAFGGGTYLIGEVKNHPRQDMFHSDFQATSLVLSIDRIKGVAETQNTIYELGMETNNVE